MMQKGASSGHFPSAQRPINVGTHTAMAISIPMLDAEVARNHRAGVWAPCGFAFAGESDGGLGGVSFIIGARRSRAAARGATKIFFDTELGVQCDVHPGRTFELS